MSAQYTPGVFEKATAAAGFQVEACGKELTFTPDIVYHSNITEEYKQRDWFIDAPLDENVTYTLVLNDDEFVTRLIASPSGTSDWVVLNSLATCGLVLPVEPGKTVQLKLSVSVPMYKKGIKTVKEQVIMDGHFKCPAHHAVMSSPGYTIMDPGTNKLMAFLSVAEVSGKLSIISATVHCNLENNIWQ